MNKIAVLIVIGIFTIIGILVYTFDIDSLYFNPPDDYVFSHEIVESWELPEILDEVSGISWIDEDRIACVQDEDGILFIYNISTSKIEKEIEFGRSGDYEGVTVHNSTAYVLRSDGTIYEIENYMSPNFKATEYQTPLSFKHDVEGLTIDIKNNRLLLAIKNQEPGDRNYKGVYGFDIATKKMAEEPVYKIYFDDSIFSEIKSRHRHKIISPSEIGIHPLTGDIYILESTNPKLLILNADGTSKKLYLLDRKVFAQPEGITFSENGTIYISNEGKRDPPNIYEVEFKD